MIIQFTAKEVENLLNIKRNALQQYLDRGFVHASINRSSRRGDTNIFSLKDVVGIGLFLHLINSGLSRLQSGEIVSLLYSNVIAKEFDPHIEHFYFKKNKKDEKLLFYIEKSKDEIWSRILFTESTEKVYRLQLKEFEHLIEIRFINLGLIINSIFR